MVSTPCTVEDLADPVDECVLPLHVLSLEALNAFTGACWGGVVVLYMFI